MFLLHIKNKNCAQDSLKSFLEKPKTYFINYQLTLFVSLKSMPKHRKFYSFVPWNIFANVQFNRESTEEFFSDTILYAHASSTYKNDM